MILQNLMLFVILPVLGLAVVLAFVRLLRGPSLPDRVVALDLLTIFGIGIVAAYSIGTNQSVFIDLTIILAILGFLATVAFAYYVERRT